jgi:succinate dehydrogenase / fumarate reductase membrane anchor subunit
MDKEPARSPLRGALGVVSAATGVTHWWFERVTAIALLPLTVWLVASIIAHVDRDYASVIAWLRTPLAASSMSLLLAALFCHVGLGLQVVIEDYVHGALKVPALIVVRLGCCALFVAGIMAVLRIALGR